MTRLIRVRLVVAAVIAAVGLTGCGSAGVMSGNGASNEELGKENSLSVEKNLNEELDSGAQDHLDQDNVLEDDLNDSKQDTIIIEETIPDISQSDSEIDEYTITREICALPAGVSVDVSMLSEEFIDELFYASKITEEVFARINGCSYQENNNISLEELSYVRVLHRGFDGTTRIGELIVNSELNGDIVDIMRELYKADYPIEQMVLIDEYGGDDNLSMAANNTSSFNYRTVSGTSKLSNHSYGRAIDINPLYNPYIKKASDGSILCEPENGADYIDRNENFAYKIDHNDLCYQLFIDHGFSWGGDWRSVKDYQHFEKEK